MTKKKEFTREEYEKGMQEPPFNYSGWELDQHMKMYDESQEWKKDHLYGKPKDMKQVSFTGYSSDTIDDNIQVECECSGEDRIKLNIAGGYITICPNCGRGYQVISYIAQYEKK